MAYIQPNKLLPPTSRVIRPFQCSMIACEGPNILGKLNMSGVEIPYYTQFTTRMILNPGSTKQPLLYGFLGSEVTFVLLKMTYDETDPRCQVEEEQFIEYYFEDQPSITRYANKLLLLTGNSTHRIPQIYLNNPSDIKVYIDAMVGNLEQSDIDIDNLQIITVDNLYYNSIISDTIWSQTDLVSGSSQLQIKGIDGNIQLYLDYIDILSIESVDSSFELRITTVSDTTIILRFLSLFDMYQARSRISWVTRLPNERYLTTDFPGIDLVPPVFAIDPILPTGTTTFSYPYVSGVTILPSEVLNYFVTGITDERDGEISVDSATITIRQYGYVEILTGITHMGVYDVLITAVDLANNQSMLNYIIICDDMPPVITFKPIAIGTGFTMTDTDMALPSEGIIASDIIRKSVDNVYDVVDGFIANSAITLIISGETGVITNITLPGQYEITYFVADRSGNATIVIKTLIYSGVVILASGQTYVVGDDVTTMDFRYGGATGTTSTIVLSGVSFLVANISGATNEEFVWDSDNAQGTYHNFGSGNTGSIQIIVLGTLFTIGFTRGSLLFKVENKGRFDVTPTGLTYSFETGLTNTININTQFDWFISDDISWLLLSSLSGNTPSLVTGTTIERNTTGYSRSGITTITGTQGATYKTIDILVTQESEPDYFSVSPSALTYSYEIGEEKTFNIYTNRDWVISDSINWLLIDIYSGNSDAVITTTIIDKNDTGSVRTGLTSITVDSGSIHQTIDVLMIQDIGEVPGYFSVSTTGISFSYGSGLTDTFGITTNKDWTVIDKPSWIDLSNSSGTNTTTITGITNETNTTGYERNELITVSGYTGLINILTTQASIPAIFSGETYTFVSDVQLIYLGEAGTIATIVLSGQSFTLENTLIYTLMFDGHEFTYVGESYIIVVGINTFEITYNGGNLIFTIRIV